MYAYNDYNNKITEAQCRPLDFHIHIHNNSVGQSPLTCMRELTTHTLSLSLFLSLSFFVDRANLLSLLSIDSRAILSARGCACTKRALAITIFFFSTKIRL